MQTKRPYQPQLQQNGGATNRRLRHSTPPKQIPTTNGPLATANKEKAKGWLAHRTRRYWRFKIILDGLKTY